MSQSIIFWQYLSLILGIISSLLAIITYFKNQQINELRIGLKQSQEQFQKIVLNLSQKVAIIEKETKSAIEVLKDRFPQNFYYIGFYSLVLIIGILSVIFLPKIADPSNFGTMSLSNWLLFVFITCIFIILPFIIRNKILKSLKGISITNVKIHFEPSTEKENKKIQSGIKRKTGSE